MSPVCFVTEVLSTLRGSARIARRRGVSPIFHAALVQTCVPLRPFRSRFASFQWWEIPSPLRLATPAFARSVRHLGSCRDGMTRKGKCQGGSTVNAIAPTPAKESLNKSQALRWRLINDGDSDPKAVKMTLPKRLADLFRDPLKKTSRLPIRYPGR
jgi:hypothetical protein